MLSRSYELASGPRVRLRLARPSDLPGIRALLAQRGLPATEIGLERLVRYDPRRRLVICAMAPVAGAETLVGLGTIELRPTTRVGIGLIAKLDWDGVRRFRSGLRRASLRAPMQQ